MKKAIVISIALVLMLFLLPSCAAGVPQEEYDRVSSDLTAVQAEIQSLQSDLSAKESELEAIKEKLEQGKVRIEILNAIFIPAMTGELEGMTEAEAVSYFLEWRDKVMAVGDPTLTAKFEVLIETFSDEALLSFFVYLLESTADALE
jgi:outer membrane murein-binding lipoprotein Lpp